MEKLDIPKGDIESKKDNFGGITVFVDNMSTVSMWMRGNKKREEDIGALVADAMVVYGECGMKPSELLKKLKELAKTEGHENSGE